jgi:hypothetical protein
MSAKREFPMAVKCGSATGKSIWFGPGESMSRTRFAMVGGTESVRITRADLDEAKAESAARSLLDVLNLTGSDRLLYVRALTALSPTGVDIETAVKEYAATRELLHGGCEAIKSRQFSGLQFIDACE